MPDSALPKPAMPVGGFAAISKYNPHLWSPEQLRALFVARQNELADLLHTLRTTPADTVGQHVLLVGARGMGKSTLMQRLALAVEDEPALNAAWLPLRFPEEQYTVATLGQFWANVLDSLADALERQGQPTTHLDAAARDIAALPAAQQADACLAAIDRCAEERGQRLLLLVDNSDLLFHNLGRDAHWILRETLQSNPRLLWVGGSYQSLEVDSGYHDAFLDFFRVFTLRPLRLEEMAQALQSLAETFGGPTARQDMARRLAAHPERLATLRQLSGGNPRSTVMLYEVFSSSREGSVRSDLEALLDNMTPLYKARMDSLADLPRKLLAHILEHWAPISLGELAAASQVTKTSISPQLQRLELEGLIEKTALHGTTRSGYQAAERFFNIWYLMRLSPRRQRARLAWLVEFMRLWFSTQELQGLAQARMDRQGPWGRHDWEYGSVLADALPPEAGERHALRWSLLKQLKEDPQLAEFFDLDGEDAEFRGAAEYLRRLKPLPALLRLCPHAKTEEEKSQWVEGVMGSLSINIGLKESLASATAANMLSLSAFHNLQAALLKEPVLLAKESSTSAAQALHDAVLRQDYFPDMPDSHLAYEQIRNCFVHQSDALRFAAYRHFDHHQDEWTLKSLMLARAAWPQSAELAGMQGWLLHVRLARYAEAESAYRQALALDHMDSRLWNLLGILLQNHLDRFEEAEDAYRKCIAINDKDVIARNNLGNLLQDHVCRLKEAKSAYRQAIALDHKDAHPHANLARLLLRRGDTTEAENLYRRVCALAQANDQHLLLQAHLFLGNRQLALDALTHLATTALAGDPLPFSRLKEQVWECHELGLGVRLATWMEESSQAEFLLPFSQALYTLADAAEKLQDLPQEARQLVNEVVAAARHRGLGSTSPNAKPRGGERRSGGRRAKH